VDAALLPRIQFGFTIGFHILYPTLTIGLAWFLVVFEACWHRSGKPHWLELYRFWVKVFALTFGMGVVSGLVLSYEIGANFSRFSAFAGPVIGPLLSAEVLTAFFVEAGFLGVMLFGWDRVGPRLHFMATLLVALGTTNSAFWILSANSWMQTPQGTVVVDGRVVPLDWLAVVFNPSFPYRLGHMLLAVFVTASLVVAGVSAYQWLRQSAGYARVGLRTSVAALAVLAPLQIGVGDLSGQEVRQNQPSKLAAIEALWRSRGDVPFVLFAWPDQKAQANRYAVEVPQAGSLVLTHTLHGEVEGFDHLPRDQQPPVVPVFFGFRLMVGLALWFLLLGFGGVWLMWRGRLERSRRYLGLLALSSPLGFVATVAGWIVAESGRQPWVVYGLLRTADATSPVPAATVGASLAVFVLVYGLLFGSYVYFVMRLVRLGPVMPARHPEAMRGARAAEIIPQQD
jgi:cytochrome d ubiquinol oxidase subunit I